MNAPASAAPAVLAAHGLSARLPAPWEGRIYVREHRADGPHPRSYGSVEEIRNPVLHAANFPLPAHRGDFGTGAVERMTGANAFLALVEYDSAEVANALFEARGMPRLALHDFAANALQRRLPGQLGCQRFFNAAQRAFCLYVVLGSRAHAASLVGQVNAVIDGIAAEAR